MQKRQSGDLNASLLINSNIFCIKRLIFNCQENKQVNIKSLISAFGDLQNLPASELNEACQILDNLMDTYPLLSSIIIRQGRRFLHDCVKHGWLTLQQVVPKRTKWHW